MTYTSFLYLFIFLPLVCGVYYLTPKSKRPWVLLLANLGLYTLWTKQLILYYFATVIFIFGIIQILDWMDKRDWDASLKKKRKNLVAFFGIVILLGILAYLKYWNFLAGIIGPLFSNQSFSRKLFMPLGISYYSLQLISLVVDFKNHKFEKPSLRDIALYTSFFGTIVLGPITRYGEVIEQMTKPKSYEFSDTQIAASRILWGLLKKLVIADSLGMMIQPIFSQYVLQGSVVLLGMILCTLQIYMDFSGSVDIAIGSARLFGIQLPENFRQPFFAENASDFWRRWHITLGHFFKDYIFYPVSLNKQVQKFSKRVRKYCGKGIARFVSPTIALFLVWIANGLWHGPQLTYLLYGMYYFALIFFELILEKPMDALFKRRNWDKNSLFWKTLRWVKLMIIVCLGETLFLVGSFSLTKSLVGSVIKRFSFSDVLVFLSKSSVSWIQWLGVLAALMLVITYNVLREKNWPMEERWNKLPWVQRWILVYALIIFVVIFAGYGPGFDAVAMMYAGF